MRPRRNCGQVYHISKGEMECLIKYGISYSLFLQYNYECVDSSNRMEPTRNLIWGVNADRTNVSNSLYYVNVYLLPYEQYEAHMNAKVASLPV